MSRLLPYAKFCAAVLGAAATSVIVVFGGDTLPGKIAAIVTAAATAVAVYGAENAPLPAAPAAPADGPAVAP